MIQPKKNPLYFITLMPPSEIRKEIETIKKEIKTKYGIKHALKLPAHITLQIPFRMQENKEDILFKKLERFSSTRARWLTELKDFGKFGKKVIFIKITEHQPFIKLHQDLQHLMLDFIELKSHEISTHIHPHITLATRDLQRSHFPEIWDDFRDRTFSATFQSEQLFLMKHNGKTWDIIRKFQMDSAEGKI